MSIFEDNLQSMYKGCIENFCTLSDALPNEYQEVEYIESTGTQAIETGVSATSEVRVDIRFSITRENASTTWSKIYGIYEGPNSFFLQSAADTKKFNTASGLNVDPYRCFDTQKYTYGTIYDISQYKNKYYRNGNLVIECAKRDFTTNVSIFIFNLKVGHNQGSYIKLYKFKLFKNGVLLRDYVPCYRKSDNEIGLYDLISKRFFMNDGTGTFLKGSNVVKELNKIDVHQSNGDPLRDYKIYGNSYQAFEPSIDNPCDIISLGEGKTDNLFGGEAFKNKIIDLGGTYNEQTRKVYIHGSIIRNKILFSDFKPNTRYTIFLKGYNSNNTYVNWTNLDLIYTDNSTESIKFDDDNISIITSKSNCSISSITGSYHTSTSYFDIDSFGIIEGVKTISDFEPYGRYIDVNVKSKNLLQTPYKTNLTSIGKSITHNGVTYTLNPDYSITCVGRVGDDEAISYLLISDIDYLELEDYGTSINHKNYVTIDATKPMSNGIVTISPYIEYSNKTINNRVTHRIYLKFYKEYGDINVTLHPYVVLGSEAIQYVPYYNETTKIYLGNHEPLRKIGDCADYIDYKNKKIVRNIYEHIIDDTMSAGIYGLQNDYVGLRYGNKNVPIIEKNDAAGLCNYFKVGSYMVYNHIGDAMWVNGSLLGEGALLCTIHESNLSECSYDAAEEWFKDRYREGKPVKTYYIRRESIEEDFPECPDIPIPEYDCTITVSSGTDENDLCYITSSTGDIITNADGEPIVSNTANIDYKINASKLEIEAYVK